ncbi:MAG: riboflavin synthase [Candidatus Glassbacteria bacterium]|nr:riboflavin synthase [Candidatus Glassbacteria bacterium]
MFTGIIEHLGRVASATPLGRGRTLAVEAGDLAAGMSPGDSIAVNGACLTVTGIQGKIIRVEAVAETVSRTNVGRLAAGSLVNLERPLKLGARLHGHLVQGHVDTTTRVLGLQKGPESVMISFALPAELQRLIVPRGSVAVDGVSLTVAGLQDGLFSCSLIGYTLEHTTLGRVKPGDEVNLEADIIGKYVAAALEGPGGPSGPLSAEKLRGWGY